MPTKYHYSRTETRCTPCPHLKFKNAIYGHDYVRGEYVCHHPDANEFGSPMPADPKITARLAEIRAWMREHGRSISKRDDIQPPWCPLKRENH